MIDFQKLVNSLTGSSLRGIAVILVFLGATLFAAGTVLSASIFTLGAILAVAVGAVIAVISFIKGNLK